MNYESLVEEIAGVIDDVPDSGQVHTYLRYTNDWTTFLSLFAATVDDAQQIRGWTVTRISESRQWGHMAQHMEKVLTFRIQGVVSSQDATETEIAAQQLVSDVMDALDVERDYDGLVDNYLNQPCQLIRFEPRQFGPVVCHYAEIELVLGFEEQMEQT